MTRKGGAGIRLPFRDVNSARPRTADTGVPRLAERAFGQDAKVPDFAGSMNHTARAGTPSSVEAANARVRRCRGRTFRVVEAAHPAVIAGGAPPSGSRTTPSRCAGARHPAGGRTVPASWCCFAPPSYPRWRATALSRKERASLLRGSRRPWERGRPARKWAAGPPWLKRAGRPRSQEPARDSTGVRGTASSAPPATVTNRKLPWPTEIQWIVASSM